VNEAVVPPLLPTFCPRRLRGASEGTRPIATEIDQSRVRRPSGDMPDAVSEYVDVLESLIMGFSQGARSVLRKNRLTAVQFLVLQWASFEGPASMSVLARFLGVRPQSVTPVVDSLVRRKWIRRRSGKTDRRQTLLELSPEAVRLMGEFRGAHLRRLKAALRKVPPRELALATRALRITQRSLASSLSETVVVDP
jgi:DNA-binding MarR family transcriptional regulator